MSLAFGLFRALRRASRGRDGMLGARCRTGGPRAWGLACVLLASGCSLVPEADPPDGVLPDRYPEGPAFDARPTAAVGVETLDETAWATFYGGETLEALIRTGLRNNRNLQRAALRIAEARTRYDVEGTRLYPDVAADGSYLRQETDAAGTAQGAGSDTFIFENYRLGVGLTAYELDFFGRLRSLKQAALSEYLATRAAARTVRIALVADIAGTYTSLRANEALRALAEETVEARSESLALIERRAREGIATDLELAQAESLLARAQVDLYDFVNAVARDRNTLRLLLGTPEAMPALAPEARGDALVEIPRDVPVGLPSELLTRRPDVIEAEYRLRAANAEIGAARAAFFPRITLTANAGYSSNALDDLFDDDSQVWRFAPQVSVPIFTAGRLEDELDLAELRRDLAINAYERTIETAFREVADALAALGTLDDQLAAQGDLVAAAGRRVELSAMRHEAGVENYLAVLDAKRELFTARQNLIRLRREEIASLIALHRALGGGAIPERRDRPRDVAHPAR